MFSTLFVFVVVFVSTPVDALIAPVTAKLESVPIEVKEDVTTDEPKDVSESTVLLFIL